MMAILACDGDADLEIVEDMRRYNIRGNNDKSLYDVFWGACGDVLERENGSGAQSKRHPLADAESTNTVSFAPGIVSIPQLQRATVKFLIEEKGKVKDVDFRVPSLSWIYLQLSPNNEYKKTAERYTGSIPFKLALQCRDFRLDHPHGHWNARMKKNWREEASRLFSLIASYQSSDDMDREPCLGPEEALSYNGTDDKASAPVGRHTPISATAKQSDLHQPPLGS